MIAGTNGKGSVTVMVETALRAAGHRTARYTSPHLVRLEERFVVDGQDVSTADLRDAVARVQEAVESLLRTGALEAPPTFFECATAAAFELFRRRGVDIAVLEVGLGGRLDATNVVLPIAAAITSIDFDHQAQLGDTIEAIAREKAGVIKPGIPVVCGPLPPDADRVIRETSAGCGARMVRAPDAVRMTERSDGAIDIATGQRRLDGVRLALSGRHQQENAAVAVALVDELARAGIAVPDAAVREGLSRRGVAGAARAVPGRRDGHPPRRRAQSGRRAGPRRLSRRDRLDRRHARCSAPCRTRTSGECSSRSRPCAGPSCARRRPRRVRSRRRSWPPSPRRSWPGGPSSKRSAIRRPRWRAHGAADGLSSRPVRSF